MHRQWSSSTGTEHAAQSNCVALSQDQQYFIWDTVVSNMVFSQCGHQYITILIIGTPKKAPVILEMYYNPDYRDPKKAPNFGRPHKE